ncbi:hypothetical protein CesoFtcFv8_023849 [Champsocephalus esox]|uniref:Uncharacterized protein n=1 Tax=Champsocephalus esox TaxID=159716 RepID=A0AAN8B534_9TELE|nr:hypothetical protein CesoFtcFv8_023849 [Champsocephalus esox]
MRVRASSGRVAVRESARGAAGRARAREGAGARGARGRRGEAVEMRAGWRARRAGGGPRGASECARARESEVGGTGWGSEERVAVCVSGEVRAGAKGDAPARARAVREGGSGARA